MGKPILRDERGRLLQGTGSPSPGRPQSSRQRIAEALLKDLSVVWEKHGTTVLERLAIEEPGKLATIAYGLLPRDVFISVEQKTPGNLEPDEWATMVELVRLIKSAAPEGSQALPSELTPALEETVRAHFAKPISG